MKHSAARKAPRARSAKAPPRPIKYVYAFDRGKAEGSSALRHLLGGKGCEIAEMTNLGVPVPPGFTITTEAWAAYREAGRQPPPELWRQIDEIYLPRLEKAAGCRLGNPGRPLLVSV